MKQIISIATLLSIAYLYLIYTISPMWSDLFSFSDEMYLLKKQFMYLLFGLSIVVFLIRLKSSILFDRIGLLVFSLSTIMLISMVFLPNSMVPLIDAKKLYIVLGGIYIYPMLFFILGIVWFINYLHDFLSIKKLNFSVMGIMLISGAISLSFHDYGGFLLLEVLLMFLLFYISGINKYFFGSILGIVLTIIVFILTSPHRLSWFQSWLYSSDKVVIKNPLDLGSLLLIINELGMVFVIFIVAFFLFLIYFIIRENIVIKKYKLFIVGISITILISLVLNIVNIFGYLPFVSFPLYFFDYGFSITVVSYLMIGMLGVLTNVKYK